ncbi:MAG TPA: isoprenylcysteine carboxylmethyltransferase family protein [Gammaproteobacteria bacterium]|nr:isoprenylcysteine carboxylmethyltransferase family protein [Gammaproteobacteria bacterium]
MPFITHLLVLLQFTGIGAACFPVAPAPGGSPYWLLICALGLGGGIVTLYYNRLGNFNVYPLPKPDARLITAGPYAYIRHPMYLCLILMMLGVALYNSSWVNYAGLALVTGAVAGKAVLEERLLLIQFPAYAGYMQRTRRIIPGVF